MARQPARRRHRRAQPPPAVLSAPIWQRILGAVLFTVGGGATAAWGGYGLVGWVASVHRGDGVIQTENFILGIPLIGAGLCALGPEFIVPRLLARWSDTVKTRVAGAVLGTMLAGIVLVVLGQIAITITMELDGYRACEVSGRGRYTAVTWAAAGTDCPAKPEAGRT